MASADEAPAKVSHLSHILIRRLTFTLMGLSVLIPAMSCAPKTPPGPLSGPSIVEKTLEPGRRYTVAIPTGYSGETAVPMILALHYGGEVTPFFGGGALRMLFEPALRELGAIMVAPDCTGRGWTDPRSLEDLWAVLDHVSSEFNIDPLRVLVTGYSMGGMGTWHLAANHPDRFSAAIVVSGRPPEGTLDGDWSVPLYVIHSTMDEVLPLEPTISAVEELEGRGVPVTLEVIDGPTHYRTDLFVDPLRASVPWVKASWGG